MKSQKYMLPAAVVLLMVACGPRMEKAELARIDQAEANWRSHPVSAYHMIVEVERPGELRQHDVTVREGKVAHAIVQYWNPKDKRWENTITLNETQAVAFTIPGLLETVRDELRNSRRPMIRVLMRPDPPYLERIVLGQEWRNDQAVPDSQASLIVREFERL